MIPDRPYYDFDQHYKRATAKLRSYPLLTEKQCQAHFDTMMERVPSVLVCVPYLEMLHALFMSEDIYVYDRFITPNVYSREDLNTFEALMTPGRISAAEDAMATLWSGLADLPISDEGDLTVPLATILAKDQLSALYSAMFEFTYDGRPLFPKLRRQLTENMITASGYLVDRYKDQPLTMPHDYDGSPMEIVERYFRNTPLHAMLNAPIPFVIPQEAYFSGQWICSPPGRGKTNYLHTLFVEKVLEDCSIICMDSKGDFIDPIKRMKLPKDVIVIEAQPGLALNPLDIGANSIELLQYIFSSMMEAKLTPLQATLFRSVLRACIDCIPDPTMETFRDLITNGPEKYMHHIKKSDDPFVIDFFEKEFTTKTYSETRQQVLWRLRLLMEDRVIRSMFSAPKTKLKLGELMDAGKIIVIDNNRSQLGDIGSEFFSRFWVALILSAGMRRPPNTGTPVYCIFDEAHTFIARDEKFADILDTLRAKRISITAAHQRIAQIQSANVLDALANCAIRAANSDEEAPALASRLRTTPEHLRSLKRGQFAFFVRDLTTQGAVTVQAPLFDLKEYALHDAGALYARETQFKLKYCYEPAKQPDPVVVNEDEAIKNW